ncbi:MAG: hypothetical protein KAR40_11095 [Candidatus Sabulitectum sp.]|nr:hypothetical protein [Candidatus Sabulitectum sp.]
MSARDEFARIYKSRLNPNTNTPMQINVFWQDMFPRFSKGYQAGLEAAAKHFDEWMKGCSNCEDGKPYECEECSEAYITAIRKLKAK